MKKYIALLIFCRKRKKFHSTELNDAPLEGLTIFLYCSSFGHTALESSRLGEFECEISPGENLRKKVMAFDNSGENSV